MEHDALVKADHEQSDRQAHGCAIGCAIQLSSLYALDRFESIDYNLIEENGRAGLELDLKRKSWGPNYVRFGLNLEDNFEGLSRYNAALRYIATELNPLGAEWLTDIQIGDNPKLFTEFYQPACHWRAATSLRPVSTSRSAASSSSAGIGRTCWRSTACGRCKAAWTWGARYRIGARCGSACGEARADRAC